ncbi:MAG: DUF885 family protein, partial [Gemmatimonadota bacterium]
MTALDRFFESYYRLRPVNATFTGVHEYDDRLPDWSPDGLNAAAAEMAELRRALASDGRLTLGADVLAGRDWDQIDRVLADAFLDIQIAELESGHFQRGNPSLAVGEALFGVISLMTRPFAELDARMERARRRLAAIPEFFAGVMQTLEATPAIPVAWVERALRECEGGRKLLTTGIDIWLASEKAHPSLAVDVRRAADAAANALLGFRERLTTFPTRTNGYGAGSDFLDKLLQRGHLVDRLSVELCEDANRELDVERRALDDTAHVVLRGGWKEIQARLADLHPEPDEFYGAFGETWRACRTLAVRRNVLTWPEDWSIRYVPIPEWTRQAAPYLYYLFYRSPAPFDTLAIHDYVVTPVESVEDEQAEERFRRAWNDSTIKLNHV